MQKVLHCGELRLFETTVLNEPTPKTSEEVNHWRRLVQNIGGARGPDNRR